MSDQRGHVPQDWAPYPRLDDAVRAYVRDADAALEAMHSGARTSVKLADKLNISVDKVKSVFAAGPFGGHGGPGFHGPRHR